MTPQEALFLDRFLADTSLSILWGGGGFTLLAAHRAQERLLTIMRMLLLASSSVGAIAAVAALPVQTAEIASDWRSAQQAGVLATVAFHTDVGISTAVQAATSLALFGAVLIGYGRTAVALTCIALCEGWRWMRCMYFPPPPGWEP